MYAGEIRGRQFGTYVELMDATRFAGLAPCGVQGAEFAPDMQAAISNWVDATISKGGLIRVHLIEPD